MVPGNPRIADMSRPTNVIVPSWLFTSVGNRMWTWRCSDTFVSPRKETLAAAIADAREHGFDPDAEYWVVISDGRTTHYRPGKAAVNLPAAEQLKD